MAALPSEPAAAADEHFMQVALRLAARGLGAVWPNPAVGCVLVREGQVIGRGWTQPGGRPHAETEALRRAGDKAQGATAYVSLEPCAHHGRTPPCAHALAEAGVARVVVAIEDPDPRVAGKGLAALRAVGIETRCGVASEAAMDLNAGFFRRLQEQRPMVTLKLATSLDGRIATAHGESRWITGAAARERAHLLRAQHDAIMVGIGTALIDDPELTCRLPGLINRSPVRIVVDGRLRLPIDSRLVRGAREVPTWVLGGRDADDERARRLEAEGVVVLRIERREGRGLDLRAGLRALAEHGLTRLMVEGGAALAADFLGQNLVDRLAWFRAPQLIGADGLAAVGSLGYANLAAAPRFRRRTVEVWGKDLLETYARET